MTFYKYNGAGNDFLIADNWKGDVRLTRKYISGICDRHYGVGADGVMLLGAGRDGADFTMDYFNSDGSGGMMCGNGGRCIVAFAAFLGLRPAAGDGCWAFLGPDGMHRAYILENKQNAGDEGNPGYGEKGKDKGESKDGEKVKGKGESKGGEKGRDNGDGLTVRLKMKDISVAEHYDSLKADRSASGWFIDTGTRHFVRMIDTPVDEKYVDRQGRNLRWTPEFAPEGVNVNFVLGGNPLKVRTFEKGVEAETCACGTGITASAAAAWLCGITPASRDAMTGALHYEVDALNDRLSVDFIPHSRPEDCLRDDFHALGTPLFTDVWLTGPATLVAEIDIL